RRSGAPATQLMADVRQAVRLVRRRCRPWHLHGADDRLLLQEALAARDTLFGRGTIEQRHRAWRRSVETPSSTAARARLAAAWAEWAVGTGAAELAAEAYQCLVGLVAADSATRYGAGVKGRLLAVAQEYAEEAGYWLARSGRYREAVLALETGRAVGLTEMLGRDTVSVVERLYIAGRADLGDAYRRAIEEFDQQERQSSPRLRQAWNDLRDVARQVAVATGADPLMPDVRYDDVTAETGDGALVYIAAAKAGGYALVVAAHHDPQFIDLPKLDRATVAALVDAVLPGAVASSRSSRSEARDAWPAEPTADPVTTGLRKLWVDGIRNLLLFNARGRIVTLIPVGLLSLLPLHAAGDLGAPGDPHTEWHHAGGFSAIRYVPNVRGLRRCRETARDLATEDLSLLAVDVPSGFGLDAAAHLRYVTRETDEVAARWLGRTARTTHDCTWEEFRTTADDYTVWHLACHGSAEPSSIMDSRLYFVDQQVSLERLRRALRRDRRRLAILSACETNLTDAAMPNEVLGLPTALIQVGFAGVIAASWRVDDLATTYLMTAFYHLWCQGDEPPVALNRAQQWLRSAKRSDLATLLPDIEPQGDRDEYPYRDPRYWAAFAYTGA
ncbi:MAG TPA: CHAT domain-containing protein, partial [Micromonosporaceae bacterium]